MRLELTRRGDYAVRAMLALADPDADPWLSVTRISVAMAIPERFLARVMRDLTGAGLVEARTGRNGGYRLARRAATISLLDVIAAVESVDPLRQCVLRGIPCGSSGRCAVHDTFTEARSALQARLDEASLADIVASEASTGRTSAQAAARPSVDERPVAGAAPR
jgi:Rrf2 family protein